MTVDNLVHHRDTGAAATGHTRMHDRLALLAVTMLLIGLLLQPEDLGEGHIAWTRFFNLSAIAFIVWLWRAGRDRTAGGSAPGSARRADETFASTRPPDLELAWLHRILDQAPLDIVVTDLDGAIRYVSEGFVRRTGYSRAEAIGANPRILKSGYTPDGTYRDMWQKVLNGDTWRGDLLNRRKDSSLFWERATIFPLMDGSGDVVRLVAIKEDITEAKEADLKLAEARRQADLAHDAKGRFLATMSHELRTPLNAVIGFASMLHGEHLGPIENAQYRDYAGDIVASGQALLDLVDNMLRIADFDEGRIDLDEVDISLPSLIGDIIEAYGQRAEAQRVHLSAAIGGDVPCLRADPTAVRQVLSNLIANGIRYTPAGGSVSVTGRILSTGAISLMVADTGCGMSEDAIVASYARFGDTATPQINVGRGAGVGLPLTRTLAELHQAAMAIDSNPGAGTLVSVTFPPNRSIAAKQATLAPE